MTSDNPPPKATNWSTVAARSARARIPRPNKQYEKLGHQIHKKVDIVFEDPEISAYLRTQRAMSIVQTALQPGSVIFTLPDSEFNKHTEAYQLIVDTIGPVVGNTFIPISVRAYTPRSGNDLVFSTMFVDPTHAKKAISEGIVVNGVTYKGIPYKDRTVANDYIRVYLSLKGHEQHVDSLVAKLKASMSVYGKVLQIKTLTKDNWFEGDASVLLDRKHIAGVSYKTLQRSLFLGEFHAFAIARFTGAEKVCYFCRKTGHIATACPALEDITCRRCKLKGHTHRRCETDLVDEESDMEYEAKPARESTFAEDYDAYMKLSQVVNKENDPSTTDGNMDETTMDTDSQVLKTISADIDNSDIDDIMEEDTIVNSTSSKTKVQLPSSSIYDSKYASPPSTDKTTGSEHKTKKAQLNQRLQQANSIDSDTDDVDMDVSGEANPGDASGLDGSPPLNHAHLGHD